METTEKQHVIGVLYEHSEAIGLRYQHTHFSAAGCGEGFLMWGGYGADLRLLESDLKRIDGGIAQLSGRIGTFPGAGVGIGAEVGAGAGPTHDGFRGLGFVGAFATFYYVDLGAAYFFPLGPFDRPEWLSNIIFAMRIHLPVATYDEHERHYSK